MKYRISHFVLPIVLGALAIAPGAQWTMYAQGAQQTGAGSSSSSASGSKSAKHAGKHKGAASADAATASKATPAAPAAAKAESQKAPAAATPATSKPATAAAPTKPAAAAQTPPSPGMVWVNTNSKVYHKAGSKFYGNTKAGKWMNEADAVKAGYRAAK